MRCLFLAVLFTVTFLHAAMGAQRAHFHAGVARPAVAGEPPFDTLVWYPTRVDEVAWQAGPFLMPATRNAALADGKFPVILLSHGGGTGGGTPLMLREIAVSLARSGFIVIAPFHGKAGLPVRVMQMHRALAAVAADPRFVSHVDMTRLGALGFSLGGAVALELAGALPNGVHLAAYCAGHAQDVMSCDHAPDADHGRPGRAQAAEPSRAPLPVKALVLMDPYAVLFQRPELLRVTMPALIFRPDHSELPGQANAGALAQDLPHPPQFETVPGTHFIFTDVCPTAIQASAPEICQDAPGVNRAAVHTTVEAQTVSFFRKNL